MITSRDRLKVLILSGAGRGGRFPQDKEEAEMERRRNGKMGRFRLDLELANYEDMVLARRSALDPAKVRPVRIPGVVDSGATRLVLPKSVVTQLGLPSAGKMAVRYADQRRTVRDTVGDVWLKLLGREGAFTAIVEPKRKDALIGAIVKEDLDLVIDCTTQKLHPRDPRWIISEVE
jgi:predicted aspartyl protease